MPSSLFPAPTGQINARSCFVLMPFASSFLPLYVQIRDFLENYCGLQCLRADEIFGSHPITIDIWKSLNEARFLIADLTGRNPNVFYELGLAHALGKNVLLLTQRMTDVPFDLNHIRAIQYDEKLPDGVQKIILETVRKYIATIPDVWTHVGPREATTSSVKITGLEMPQSVKLGHQFEIRLTARNLDGKVREGYFSISFPLPDGIEGFPPPAARQVNCGTRGDKWSGGQVRLRYPIIERVDANWEPGIEHLLSFRGSCTKRGLLWVYLSASSLVRDSEEWGFDPPVRLFDIDQRRENVYCAVIEVV